MHVPSEVIAAFAPDWGAGLLGDKAHSVMSDNSEITRLVPELNAKARHTRGVREVLAGYDADPARQVVDRELDGVMDWIVGQIRTARP